MPTAVVRRNEPQKLIMETLWLAEDTHPDPRCILSCIVVNEILRLGFEGASKPEALSRVKQTISEISDISQVDIWDALNGAPTHKWENWKNAGYTVDTVKCALAAWYQNDYFEDGLVKVVNRGNDADTVGAVAGALLGAYHGFKTIPQRGWNALGPDIKQRLTTNTKGLLEIGVSKPKQ
jgi:ADP-ribosylglycohydrolase